MQLQRFIYFGILSLSLSACRSELMTNAAPGESDGNALPIGTEFRLQRSQITKDSTYTEFVTGRVLAGGFKDGYTNNIELHYADAVDTLTSIYSGHEVKVYSKPFNTWLRYPLDPGVALQYTIRSGELESTISCAATRRDTISINGRPVPCIVIEKTENCAHANSESFLTNNSTMWFAPSVGLFVKSEDEFHYPDEEENLQFTSKVVF